MAIKAVSIEVIPIPLIESDPSGETIFFMRPATGRDDIRRGDLLRNRAYAQDDVYGVVTKVEANLPELRVEELWLLYDHAECVIETGEDEKSEPFKEKKLMKRSDFMTALWMLPVEARSELWAATIALCAKGWLSPF